MYVPPSTKTEHRAVNALETIIDDHPTMEHQFNGNDKEMSWDGFIWLFKNNNGDQSKKNLESRVPVQIKGHNDLSHKYIGKDRITYSIDIDDLRAYSKEKGVLYFQIFIAGKEREIFYSSLFPSKIADYLEEATKRGNKESLSIPFARLEKDSGTLYIVAKQFSDEAIKQGTALNPLVEDRIRFSDLQNLTSVTLTVVGAVNELDMLHRLSSGDICLYGKTKGNKYFRPIEWKDNMKFFAGRDVEQPIAIDDKVYYNRCRCVADSEQDMTLVLSPNLILRLSKGRIDFRASSTIKEIAYDARFLLHLTKSASFCISTEKIVIDNLSIADDFVEMLTLFIEVCETLEMIGFDVNTIFSQYSETEQSQFVNLVNIRMGAYNNQLSKGINKYNWKIGGKIYPLLIQYDGKNILLSESLYSTRYEYFIPCSASKDARGFKMPLFMCYDVSILSNLYRNDYDALQQQIDESDFNEYTADVLLESALSLINVFDINKDYHFLDLSEHLLNKLQPIIQAEIYMLNTLQIKKRKGPLSKEEISQLTDLDIDHEQFRFGKYVILENKDLASYYYEQFSDEDRKQYQSYPIFTLYSKL